VVLEVKTMLKTESAEENKRIAERLFEEVMNRGNLQAIDDLVAEDYKLNDPQGLPAGRDGVHAMVGMFRTGFPDLRMSVEEMVGERDMVAIRWIGTGTHRGEFMGLSPTGEQVQVRGTSLLRFRDGKISEEWTYFTR
jgi:steroid delta-isomerase-like uncharacterized protein